MLDELGNGYGDLEEQPLTMTGAVLNCMVTLC
jgi:hypothetical protein